MKATSRFDTMALYVAFFPQLIAGPIERAGRLMPQIETRQPRSYDDVSAGISRILWGLMKKIVFADWLSIYVSSVYSRPNASTSWELALATYAFAFQIYLDFSAYTDIAIGLARTMGITLNENFRWPYLARNISEFWRRWHISLSTWLRDYLYIPLGGSRLGTWRNRRKRDHRDVPGRALARGRLEVRLLGFVARRGADGVPLVVHDHQAPCGRRRGIQAA